MEQSPRDAILIVLQHIPCGKVVSYGQVASLAGLGKAARFVGQTLRTLPKGSTVPWHRVINSQGKISFPADSPAYSRQKSRLIAEGIRFNNERIDLRIYGWTP